MLPRALVPGMVRNLKARLRPSSRLGSSLLCASSHSSYSATKFDCFQEFAVDMEGCIGDEMSDNIGENGNARGHGQIYFRLKCLRKVFGGCKT
jgi:hypothetical protein